MILKYRKSLINERLHINSDIDKFSDEIYPIIKQSEQKLFEFTDLKAYFLGIISQNKNAPIDATGNMFKIIREFRKDFWKEFI